MAAKKIALFIDADNVSPKFGKQIIDALTARGEIFIRRIYGNWEKNILHGWHECILNFALRAVQQTDFVAGKNATDMSLTIDAMDIFYGGQADIFALVSNDSDFTPLAIRLREGGMNVVGLGNGHAANAFRLACSEFIDLDTLAVPAPVEVPAPKKKSAPQKNSPVQLSLFDDDEKVVDGEKIVEFKPQRPTPEKILTPPKVSGTPAVKVQSVEKISPAPVANPKVVSISDKKIQQVHDALTEATKIHGDEKGFVDFCWTGAFLKDNNLDVKSFGYGALQTFIEAFPELYETHRVGNTVSFRCLTKIPDDEKIRRIHDVLREAAEVHADATGFAELSHAGNALAQKNLSIKGLGHATLQKFVAAFPNLYELSQTGKIVRYRCRTVAPPKISDDEKIRRIHEVLHNAFDAHANADGFCLMSDARTALKNKNLGFTVRDLGYNQLREFIAAFPELYETRHDDVGQNFRYRCRP